MTEHDPVRMCPDKLRDGGGVDATWKIAQKCCWASGSDADRRGNPVMLFCEASQICVK